MNSSTIAILIFVGVSLVISLLALLTYLNFERYRFKGDQMTMFFTVLGILFLATFLITLALVPAAEAGTTSSVQGSNFN